MLRLIGIALAAVLSTQALAQPVVVGNGGSYANTTPGNVVTVGPTAGQAQDSGVPISSLPSFSGLFTANHLVVGGPANNQIQDAASIPTTAPGAVIVPRGMLYGAGNVTAAPSSFGNWGAVSTACAGDLRKVLEAACFQITGSATLGQPTTGYLYTQEAYPNPVYLYNSSGFNNSTSGNTGRTAAVAHYTKVEQAGQGDAVGNTVVCGLDGQTLAGATSFLANPACGLYDGNAVAGASGQYLNLTEFDANDNGFDVAAIGTVINLTRTVGTGALGATWIGFRVQSVGSTPADTAFSASGSGGFKFGLDLSNATLDANAAAITLAANQRIYGNVTAGQFFPSGVSNTYFFYSSANSGWDFVVGAQPALLLQSTEAFIYGPTVQIASASTNRINMIGAVTTVAPQIIAFGGDTNIDLSLSGKGTGTLVVPNVATGTPVASLCLDSTNHIVKKTTAGSCI